MKWFSFKLQKVSKNFLGIDIGTSSIRVIELAKKGPIKKLENYGEVRLSAIQKAVFRTVEKNSFLLSNREVALAIREVLKEANIQSTEVNFSIPDFASFFTNFELPQMSQKELDQAVKYEARSYVPLPLSEVTLDWSIITEEAKKEDKNKAKAPLKILVVAIPNEIIQQYQEIAKLASLEMKSLEAEAFALARSSLKEQKKATAIVDIGARSTTVNIIKNGILEMSHSFNISGNELTEILSRSLKINYEKAEELKKNIGIVAIEGPEKNIREILLPLIDSVVSEIKKIFQDFFQQESQGIEKIILSGSTALMPGLKDYFSAELGKELQICDPFSDISHLPVLEETLKEMGPTYAIAVGLALKGLE